MLMGMIPERWMEITFSEGRKLRFKFPIQATDETAAQRIEDALKLPAVTISTGDQLFVIPTAAIQSIVVTPAPKKLPRSVIRGAKLVS